MDTADLVYMCQTVGQHHRWSDTDDNSDTDSVAELNCGMWDDACAGDYHNTLGNIQNLPTYKRRNDDTDHGSDADPSRSWYIKLGKTHAHGGVGVRW